MPVTNQITTFLDPTKMPSRIQDQATFDSFVATFFQLLPTFGAQFNAGVASFNAAAAGSAYAIPYTVDLSTTADGDPGPGVLRFDNATQNAAATLRLDLLNNLGTDCTAMLDTFDGSTSSIKGTIRIVKQGDGTKFVLFSVTARAAPAGYRNISVTPIAASAASPFGNGDAVLLFFQRTGDKGDTGTAGQSGFSNMLVLRSTQNWVAPAGVLKAKITIVDGGYSTQTTNNGSNAATPAGRGGNTSISVRAVVPGTTYTATVGAGGAAPGSFTQTQNAGGLSSFSGSGFTTLTALNGDIQVPGGAPLNNNGGTSFYGNYTVNNQAAGASIGQGAGATIDQQPGYVGAAGAVIIEY